MTAGRYEQLTNDLTGRGIDVASVEGRLKHQRIETPSRGFGNSGTRFKVFKTPAAPRTAFERISDVAAVH